MNTDMASPFSSRDTLLETAWAALSHKQQAHCKVSVLQAEVSWQWERARNRIIAGWAAHTLAAVPTMVLRQRLTVVLDLVNDELGDSWEIPDEEDEAEATACGLACLRWVHLERAIKAPLPNHHFSDDELRLFITAQQMPLLAYQP